MELIFFGSGPVGAKSLELLNKNFTIETVITKPKPLHHKGVTPVIEMADKLGIRVLTAENKSSLSTLIKETKFNSKIGVLIDFGIIVSQDVIDSFELGIVNSHFSLLPKWRGADPIRFSILSGDKKTGVSLMILDRGMDTGKLLMQKSIPLETDETEPSLTDKLIKLSDSMLKDALKQYKSEKLRPRAQPHPNRATYSRKISKSDGLIDWDKPADDIEREIRAFVEWPKSRTNIGSVEVIISKAKVKNISGQVGKAVVKNNQLLIGCGQDSLLVLKLKPIGKQTMDSTEFIRGYSSRI
jgi:methionyl-tRNA formyltransferase